jgi:hypothetical protein
VARTNSDTPPRDDAPRNTDVPDEMVSQVGKAVSEVMKLRQHLEENMARARTDDERQSLAEQAEADAVRAITDQSLSTAQYNEVVSAAQSDPELQERMLTAYRLA